jgi:homoserine kinase
LNKIKVFAPASVSNVGPGFDVMGFAVNNLGDEITAIKKNKSYGVKITEIECPGFKIPKAVSKNTAGTAAKSLLKTLDFPFGVELRIKKNYGIGTGLGSSASSAAAAVFAVNKLAGEPLTKIELVNFAMEGEKVASGNYHADNIAPSLLGGFTIIRNYTPLDIIKLKPNMKIYCGLFMPKN